MAENDVTGVRNAQHAEQDSICRLRTNRIRISGGMLRLDAGLDVTHRVSCRLDANVQHERMSLLHHSRPTLTLCGTICS